MNINYTYKVLKKNKKLQISFKNIIKNIKKMIL